MKWLSVVALAIEANKEIIPQIHIKIDLIWVTVHTPSEEV